VAAAVQFAQKAVVQDNGKVLMVRKSEDDPNYPGQWELPGGRLKDAEMLSNHMVREVLEETGLTVVPGPPIDLWSWDMSWHGEHVRVVAVSRYCTLVPAAPAELRREADDYLIEQQWFSTADLLALDIIPSQRPTIEKVVHSSS
jgi:8-oxo-dGTP diphosphatase